MDEVIEAKQKWISSADAWISTVQRGDLNRTHLLDPVMLKCVGDISGQNVIDIGCGEGRFSRILSEKGAIITGIDLTPSLIEEAKRLDPAGNYLEASAEALPFDDDSFDIAISYIVLVDVSDFRTAIDEMARVTKPGGRIVVANVNSLATTCSTGWIKDAEGKKMHFPVDGYFEERGLRHTWSGISIINWHRPLTAYMSMYLKAGLVLKEFLEPCPTPEALKEHPNMVDETRIALFNVMVWEKPKVA